MSLLQPPLRFPGTGLSFQNFVHGSPPRRFSLRLPKELKVVKSPATDNLFNNSLGGEGLALPFLFSFFFVLLYLSLLFPRARSAYLKRRPR